MGDLKRMENLLFNLEIGSVDYNPRICLVALEEIQNIRLWTNYGETNLDKLEFSYVFLEDIENDITSIYKESFKDMGYTNNDITLQALYDWYIDGGDGLSEIVDLIIELDY